MKKMKSKGIFILLVLMIGLSGIANAESFQSTLGKGYEEGGYQQNSIKPTVINESGQSKYIGPDSPTIKWVFECDLTDIGTEMSSPVIGFDGTIYTVAGGSDRQLYAIGFDGSKKWSRDLLFNGNATSIFPILNNQGNIYIKTGNFYELDIEGYKKNVFTRASGRFGTASIGNDGTVYIGGKGYLYALNPDLSEKWKFKNYESNSTPIIGASGTIYLLGEENLYAINPDGTEKWTYKIDGGYLNPVLGPDETIYVANLEGFLKSISQEGKLNWEKKFSNSVMFSYASVDKEGTVYVAVDNQLIAINQDGSEKWRFESDYEINQTTMGSTSKTIIDGKGSVYFTTGNQDKGKLYSVNSEGIKNWDLEIPGIGGTTPAIGSDGTLYVSSNSGRLYAIGQDYSEEQELTDVYISTELISMKKGEEYKLRSAAVYDQGTRKDVTALGSWSSSDSEIISVENGLVKAINEGSATLTFTYEGLQKECQVKVIGSILVPIEPFEGKDIKSIREETDKALQFINQVRLDAGLGTLKLNEKLVKAAQSHSNYKLMNGDSLEGAHYQKIEDIGFTGSRPSDRASYYGYEGSVGEGIARLTTARIAVEGLLNAPYHRMDVLNPNYTEIGIGYNPLGVTVANYGTTEGFSNNTVVIYPYNGQKDVPVVWYDNENPSPLERFGKSMTFAGFPISLSLHDAYTKELVADLVVLKDSNGEEVPYYLINDTDSNSIFVIPKNILKLGAKYEVYIRALRKLQTGEEEVIERSWEFSTQDKLIVSDIYFSNESNGTFSEIPERIEVKTIPQVLPQIEWYLKDLDGNVIYYKEGSDVSWTNKYHDMKYLDTIPEGTYHLEIYSGLFDTRDIYEVYLDSERKFSVVQLIEEIEVIKNNDATAYLISYGLLYGNELVVVDLPQFNPEKFEYQVKLPYNLPKETEVSIFVFINDNKATYEVIYPETFPLGDVLVKITAEDGKTTNTYKISFAFSTAEEHTDASLKNILINGYGLEGFDSEVKTYEVSLPYETTELPEVVAEPSYCNATVNIIPAEKIPGDTVIEVTAEDGVTIQRYIIHFDYIQTLLAELPGGGRTIIIGNTAYDYDYVMKNYDVMYTFKNALKNEEPVYIKLSNDVFIDASGNLVSDISILPNKVTYYK